MRWRHLSGRSLMSVRIAMLSCAAAAALAGCSHAGGAIPAPPAGPVSAGAAQTASQALLQPNIQTHQLTDEYFADGAPGIGWAKMAPWLTWATATAQQSLILRGLGVKTKVYTDPNRVGPGDPMYTNEESTFAHDCSGHRITFPKSPGKFLMDPHSSKLATLWAQYVDSVGGSFDAVYEDSADVVERVTNTLPCNFNQSDWTAATNAMDKTLQQHIVYNGLGSLSHANGVWSISPSIGLNSTSVAGQMEGCYSAAEIDSKPHEKVWAVLENTEIKMVNAHTSFVCRGLNQTASAQAIPLRMYMDGSFLLTYDPATSIISSKFTTPSGFLVNPEVEFVPTNPVISEPSDVSALQQSGGAYGREYSACYLLAIGVGKCAVVVNADHAKAEPFPWPGKYTHTLSLHGGGVLDGGTISVSGGPPPKSLQPESAVIATQ